MESIVLRFSGIPKQLAGLRALHQNAPFAAATLLLPLIHHLYHDYRAFIALGPGGTPPTFTGYLRIKVLSFFALRDPCTPAPIPKWLRDSPGYLGKLAERAGPRPVVQGIAPHRQTTQRAGAALFDKLATMINVIGSTNDHLVLGTSCFEKHGTGLFAVSPIRRTCKGEICHAHPSDGSMHMTLHPADAKRVIEAGWAERHPLARGGWFERFVPGGFVMVYAPRSEEDLATLLQIVDAAAYYINGGIRIKLSSMERKDSGCDLANDEGAERKSPSEE